MDSKSANNGNLHIAIDRILQNINGHSSNGVIVGPEFSRMIAEVLLGHIDQEVKYTLAEMDLRSGRDYRIFRFVDDLYIFTNHPEDRDKILETIRRVSRQYLLQLNESKCVKSETPVVLSKWIGESRDIAGRISDLFSSKSEVAADKGPLVKNKNVQTERIMDDFVCLLNEHPEEKPHIVSFMLSTLLNKISEKKNGYTLFDENSIKTKPNILLELAFYFYSFYPSFESTRKLLSMLVYMNDEVHFKDDEKKSIEANKKHREKLIERIRRYSFIFEKGNLNDLVNWFVFLHEYQIPLTSRTEKIIEERLEQEDNPMLWANYLIYSRYYNGYHTKIKERVGNLLEYKLDQMGRRDAAMREDFWYVLVFCNWPDLPKHLKPEMQRKIDMLHRFSRQREEAITAVDELYCEACSDSMKNALEVLGDLLKQPVFFEKRKDPEFMAKLVDGMKSVMAEVNKLTVDAKKKKDISDRAKKCFQKINDMEKGEVTFALQVSEMIYDFLNRSAKNLFFNWDYYRIDVTKQMTFRTSRMTDFRPYKNKKSDVGMGSLDG